jgi:hypothetical protein
MSPVACSVNATAPMVLGELSPRGRRVLANAGTPASSTPQAAALVVASAGVAFAAGYAFGLLDAVDDALGGASPTLG